MRTVIYEAFQPDSGATVHGWAGFIEDRRGHVNLGWHRTRAEAESAASEATQ